MADNRKRYGFRAVSSITGNMPKPIPCDVADAAQFQNDGAGFSVDLNVGDPVKLAATGGVALANTTNVVYGVVAAILQYWDSANGVVVSGDRVPGGTTGGGLMDRRTRVAVIPAKGMYFEVDCDDAVTAATEAAYRAFINENVEFVCPGDQSVASKPKADPMIDISGHAVTATLGCRIVDVSQTAENKDFSGANVKLIVAFNETSEAGAAASASIVAGL